jgi:hypothetical protein
MASPTSKHALGEAADLAVAGYQHAGADGSVIGSIWFALILGRGALQSARVRTSRRWFAQAEARCRGLPAGDESDVAVLHAELDEDIATRT